MLMGGIGEKILIAYLIGLGILSFWDDISLLFCRLSQ